MTTSWTEKEKTWPVLLYRREGDGWKKQDLKHLKPHATLTLRHINGITEVAPRKDSVVFPNLRQKFSLRSKVDQGSVIRRSDKILLTSKRRTRSLLLQFQSVEECLSFSDKFVSLNNNNHLSSTASQLTVEIEDEARPAIVRDDEHRDVVSWVTRLLYDENFLSYIFKLETYISNTDDGAKILQGLEGRQLAPNDLYEHDSQAAENNNKVTRKV